MMCLKRFVAGLLLAACGVSPLGAQEALAPVEARVPFAPTPFAGSDGLTHLAYEFYVTNFYGDGGAMKPQGLKVFGDASSTPLLDLSAQDLSRAIGPTSTPDAPVAIAPGKRKIFFVWITLPAGAPMPHSLRHRMAFIDDKQVASLLDGAVVPVRSDKTPTLGEPLRGGRWWAHEGPGASQSHHWGSLVAVNGALTIPQRYALDLVGLDAQGHAMRPGVKDIQHSSYADWVGYGADVLAVADGVVRKVRDGEPEHQPLSPQPEPTSLTADGLFGNYVVLEIEPGVFASYAHLQRGSVKVKPGDHVHKGEVLARLGQSGNSAAPHLHFQLSNAASFEGSEGTPYVFEHFGALGPETESQVFGQGEPWKPAGIEQRTAAMPLNDIVVQFPDR